MVITRQQAEHMARGILDRDISERLAELLSVDGSPHFNLTLEGMPDGD